MSNYIINEKNQLLVKGNTEFCQLGIKDTHQVDDFTYVMDAICIKPYSGSCMFLSIDEEVYASGMNPCNKFGINEEVIKKTTKIFDGKAREIHNAAEHSIIITHDNEAYVCGNNRQFKLGLDHCDSVKEYTKIPYLEVRTAGCGNVFSIFITVDDEVYVCGEICIESCTYDFRLHKIPDFKAKSVSCCPISAMFITETDEIYVVGNNQYNILGFPDIFNIPLTKLPNFRARKSFIKYDSTILITEDDDVYVCGLNYLGQFGLGDSMPVEKFTMIPDFKASHVLSYGPYYTLYIKQNGDIYYCGKFDEAHQSTVPTKLEGYSHYIPPDDRRYFKMKSARNI